MICPIPNSNRMQMGLVCGKTTSLNRKNNIKRKEKSNITSFAKKVIKSLGKLAPCWGDRFNKRQTEAEMGFCHRISINSKH